MNDATNRRARQDQPSDRENIAYARNIQDFGCGNLSFDSLSLCLVFVFHPPPVYCNLRIGDATLLLCDLVVEDEDTSQIKENGSAGMCPIENAFCNARSEKSSLGNSTHRWRSSSQNCSIPQTKVSLGCSPRSMSGNGPAPISMHGSRYSTNSTPSWRTSFATTTSIIYK